jgi:hypothetical protein
LDDRLKKASLNGPPFHQKHPVANRLRFFESENQSFPDGRHPFFNIKLSVRYNVGEGGDKMNKIVAFLLVILFALSILGCATTQDRAERSYDKSYYEPMQRTSDP